MPTIISHALIPLAGAGMLGQSRVAIPVVAAGVALSIFPDADVVGFRMGIDYGDDWGHRGATHSLVFAAAMAGLVTALLRPERWLIAFAFLFVSCASHGLLDMATNGGLGIAIYWPFDTARHFWPQTPIQVSPIGIRNFMGERGLAVLESELRWIWIPVLVATIPFWFIRRQNDRRRHPT